MQASFGYATKKLILYVRSRSIRDASSPGNRRFTEPAGTTAFLICEQTKTSTAGSKTCAVHGGDQELQPMAGYLLDTCGRRVRRSPVRGLAGKRDTGRAQPRRSVRCTPDLLPPGVWPHAPSAVPARRRPRDTPARLGPDRLLLPTSLAVRTACACGSIRARWPTGSSASYLAISGLPIASHRA